jgi:hypothetical protein
VSVSAGRVAAGPQESTVDLGFAWAKMFLLCEPRWTTGSIMAIFH